jgi:hypothetical protein
MTTIELAALWRDDIAGYRIAETATHWVDVTAFLFTTAIVFTPKGDPTVYVDRWCYRDLEAAAAAARGWDTAAAWTGRPGGPEPTGWHRHPGTGRRRPGGDPTKEYVSP